MGTDSGIAMVNTIINCDETRSTRRKEEEERIVVMCVMHGFQLCNMYKMYNCFPSVSQIPVFLKFIFGT